MTLSVDFWQLVGLLITFFGFVAGGAKILFNQIDRRLEQRFKAQDEARKHHEAEVSEKLKEIGDIDRSLSEYRRGTDLRIHEFTDRVARIEEAAESAVTHDDLSRIHEKINNIGREVSEMNGSVKSVTDLVRSIDNHIREKK
jgi:hypothetical protein